MLFEVSCKTKRRSVQGIAEYQELEDKAIPDDGVQILRPPKHSDVTPYLQDASDNIIPNELLAYHLLIKEELILRLYPFQYIIKH